MKPRRHSPSLKLSNIHIVGIVGVGTSAIATWAQGAGIKVTGSDVAEAHGPAKVQLDEAGITWVPGFNEKNIDGKPDLVVVTNDHGGIDENLEAVAAKKLGLRVVTYGRALAQIVQGKKVVAVAGTHGKTTTATMLALILKNAGLDPSWIVGSRTPDLGTNGHAGKGEYFVVEADEYLDKLPGGQPKLLYLQPTSAILTSLEFEHPDVFKNEAALGAIFRKFIKQINPGGDLVINTDYPPLARLIKVASGQGLRVHPYSKKKLWPNLPSSLPGPLYALNATAAARMSHELGVSQDVIRTSLASFQGATRRFEKKGERGGITFLDDYAHHPTAIRMTIDAIREKYPHRRVVVVFEPHTFSRTKALKKEFAAALSSADLAWITDVYPSREKPETPNEASTLAKEVAELAGGNVAHVSGNLDLVANTVKKALQSGDVVTTMGAGSIYKLHDLL